ELVHRVGHDGAVLRQVRERGPCLVRARPRIFFESRRRKVRAPRNLVHVGPDTTDLRRERAQHLSDLPGQLAARPALLRREVGGLQIGPAEQVFDDLLRAPPAARGPPLVELGRLLLRETQHDVHGPLLVRALAPLRALLIGHRLPPPPAPAGTLLAALRAGQRAHAHGPAAPSSLRPPPHAPRSPTPVQGTWSSSLSRLGLIKPSPAWWPVAAYKASRRAVTC